MSPGDQPGESDLLSRYVAGHATPEEQEIVERRMQLDAAFRAEYDRVNLLWERAGTALHLAVTNGQVDHAWMRIAADLDKPPIKTVIGGPSLGADGAAGRLRPGPTSIIRRWRRVTIATMVVLVVGAGLVTLTRRLPSPPVATAAIREIVTAPRQRLAVSLGDGTRVTLAPGTRLLVPESFAADSRSVRLEGRAYFAVAPEADRPFLVHVDGAVTRVLGTEFDVRAYPGVSTEVVVRSGRVEVRSTSKAAGSVQILDGGDHAEVGADGQVQVQTGVAVDALLGWTEGTLTFRGATLGQVIPELERWFDISVQLDYPGLCQRRLTATFRDEPLDVVLQTIAQLVDARVQREGRQVVFSPLRTP